MGWCKKLHFSGFSIIVLQCFRSVYNGLKMQFYKFSIFYLYWNILWTLGNFGTKYYFCEWHSHEPYSTCHSWPIWDVGVEKITIWVTHCCTVHTMHNCGAQMWHTKCDTPNVTHQMWHTQFDIDDKEATQMTHTMWHKWGGDTDREVTQLGNHKKLKAQKMNEQLNIVWKHKAAITYWVTTVHKTHHEPM